MPAITIVIAILLILVGGISYLASGNPQPTALIPAYLGVVLLILGALAFKPGLRKHMMHAVVVLSLLGFLAAGQRLATVLGKTAGNDFSLGVFGTGGMTVLCLILVILCVNSFIAARKARTKLAA